VKVNDTLSINMMCVEGGTFTMGEGRSGAHQVTLSDYYIGETEVTQGLWKAVMGSIPDGQEYEGDEYPVAFVSLADCRVFVERLSQMTGKFFRIPTEAEWEYAARGGKHSKGYIYAGSNSIDEVAWYKDNMTEYQPHAVKQLKPNELGTYDMTGNLCE
jgi:formylglycine-generating enzyme required for sulfatase activity